MDPVNPFPDKGDGRSPSQGAEDHRRDAYTIAPGGELTPMTRSDARAPVLFVTRLPPDPQGPGGSQRAMNLLRGALRHGPVDLIMLHRKEDREAITGALDVVRPLVRSCTSWEIPEWAPAYSRWPRLPWRIAQMMEAAAIGSVDAPRFSQSTLVRIAALLPEQHYDVVLACRLSSATIVDALISRGLLAARRKVVDLDDRTSTFKRRWLTINGASEGRLRRRLLSHDISRLERAEQRIALGWNAVSLASGVDADLLAAASGRTIATLPNAVHGGLLPPAASHARVLFVGHLAYPPNIEGLTRFLEEGWPVIRAALPHATLDVVGRFPDAAIAASIEAAGARLHADVPDVEPFYAEATLVVAPIHFGSGTRIKIIEAMALGRAVVTTTIGAEGLEVQHERNVLMADDMASFAQAVVRLAGDAALRQKLVRHARAVQQRLYSPSAMASQLASMIDETAVPLLDRHDGDGGLR